MKFKYRGYIGESEDSVTGWYGKIIDIDDLVTFESNTLAGLIKEFEKSVDEYIEMRKLSKVLHNKETRLMMYKDYICSYHIVSTSNPYHNQLYWGKVLGVNNYKLIFNSLTLTGLEQTFMEAIDTYISHCNNINIEPEKLKEIQYLDATGYIYLKEVIDENLNRYRTVNDFIEYIDSISEYRNHTNEKRCFTCKASNCHRKFYYVHIRTYFKNGECIIEKEVMDKDKYDELLKSWGIGKYEYKLPITDKNIITYYTKKSFDVTYLKPDINYPHADILIFVFDKWLKHRVICGRSYGKNLLEMHYFTNNNHAKNYIQLLQKVTNYKVAFYKTLYDIK